MKPLATAQKLRGGYYTPAAIADFLVSWAITSPNSTILEPSFGDGNILLAAIALLENFGHNTKDVAKNIYGVELDVEEAAKVRIRAKEKDQTLFTDQLYTGDFFSYCKQWLSKGQRFDVVIGNPPFIRYQNFPEEYRSVALGLMARVGLKPNRLTNAWVPFLVASTMLLNEQGKLAMVIPAELLQVNYASQLRQFLAQSYDCVTLVTFRKLVFSGIQQEVVLLLCERNSGKRTGIRTVELNNEHDLKGYDHVTFTKSEVKPLYHSSEKWTKYFLETDEILLLRSLREHSGLTFVGDVVDVDVGIVTGLNDFFVLTEEQARQHDLGSYTQPLVGRSAHLGGIYFTERDWEDNVHKQRPAYLLNLPASVPDAFPIVVQEYIKQAEDKNWHTGYKCRIRHPWYVVPSIWSPDAFMLRQIHRYPKIVVNTAGATCTDTIHRVRLRNDVESSSISVALLNSLTFAFSEITGRSYGGGVLELEPREAEQLPLPLHLVEQLDVEAIHQLMLRDQINEVLKITDRVLLHDGLGLSHDDIRRLNGIWQKLRDRRINRK